MKREETNKAVRLDVVALSVLVLGTGCIFE